MRAVYTLVALAGTFAISDAQISSGPDGSIRCPETPVNASYCAGSSLSTNIIIRCDGRKGVPGNCNDNLAGISPVGVKSFAPCYQSSPEAGDAACSFNGNVYGANGTSFPVPGYSGSNSKPSYVAPYPTNLAPSGLTWASGSVAASIPASVAPSPPASFTSKTPVPLPTPGSFPPSVQPSILPSVKPSVVGSVTSSISATASGSVTGSSPGSTSTSTGLPTPLSGNGASGLEKSAWAVLAGVIAAGLGMGIVL